MKFYVATDVNGESIGPFSCEETAKMNCILIDCLEEYFQKRLAKKFIEDEKLEKFRRSFFDSSAKKWVMDNLNIMLYNYSLFFEPDFWEIKCLEKKMYRSVYINFQDYSPLDPNSYKIFGPHDNKYMARAELVRYLYYGLDRVSHFFKSGLSEDLHYEHVENARKEGIDLNDFKQFSDYFFDVFRQQEIDISPCLYNQDHELVKIEEIEN